MYTYIRESMYVWYFYPVVANFLSESQPAFLSCYTVRQCVRWYHLFDVKLIPDIIGRSRPRIFRIANNGWIIDASRNKFRRACPRAERFRSCWKENRKCILRSCKTTFYGILRAARNAQFNIQITRLIQRGREHLARISARPRRAPVNFRVSCARF